MSNQKRKVTLNTLRHFTKSKMHFFGNLISKVLARKILLSHPSERKCQVCEKVKPLTSEYFQPVKNFASGYSTYCNKCDQKSRIQKNEKKK